MRAYLYKLIVYYWRVKWKSMKTFQIEKSLCDDNICLHLHRDNIGSNTDSYFFVSSFFNTGIELNIQHALFEIKVLTYIYIYISIQAVCVYDSVNTIF